MQDLVVFYLCERRMSMIMCFIVNHFFSRAKANFVVYNFLPAIPPAQTCWSDCFHFFHLLRGLYFSTLVVKEPPIFHLLQPWRSVEFILFAIDFAVINPRAARLCMPSEPRLLCQPQQGCNQRSLSPDE